MKNSHNKIKMFFLFFSFCASVASSQAMDEDDKTRGILNRDISINVLDQFSDEEVIPASSNFFRIAKQVRGLLKDNRVWQILVKGCDPHTKDHHLSPQDQVKTHLRLFSDRASSYRISMEFLHRCMKKPYQDILFPHSWIVSLGDNNFRFINTSLKDSNLDGLHPTAIAMFALSHSPVIPPRTGFYAYIPTLKGSKTQIKTIDSVYSTSLGTHPDTTHNSFYFIKLESANK